MTTFDHPPRILFLYGSLRERSYSRFLAEEAARIIKEFGAEVKFFDPRELPIYGSVPDNHPKVQELRQLSLWSEGQVWSSPELHGQISGIMKNQIDWIPLSIGAVRPTQGRTLAVMQVDHPKSINDHPKSINDHPNSINDHPKSINDHPKSINDHPNSIYLLHKFSKPHPKPDLLRF
nr:NAD(P)H-dependent oxidoreductase [Nostoc mirabile]